VGAGKVTVASAGTNARSGYPAHEFSHRLAARRDVSLDAHRSRPVTVEELLGSVLVLTMSRRQRQVVARLHDGLAQRTFTVREFVTLVQVPGQREAALEHRQRGGGSSARARVTAMVEAADWCRSSTILPIQLDVPDPVGGVVTDFDALGNEFDAATRVVVEALFGKVTPTHAGSNDEGRV
jgi:protein-tyrosine-phosphatase